MKRTRRIITLLTDFGLADHYVAAMKGVMLGICPEAQLIDVSHEIAPYAIAEASFTLAQTIPCFPEGAVHLVVVDPGVGSARRPVLAEAGGHYFVAPDNGVLTMVLDSVAKYKVREITAARYFRKPVSRTFHGRDLFAPVAAHLANSVRPSQFGKRIENPVRLECAKPKRHDSKRWIGTILKVDRFGNAVTNFESKRWLRLKRVPFEMKLGAHTLSRLASTYAEMPSGELFAIAGSAGFLEISLNGGSAASRLGIRSGSAVELSL